MYWNEAERADWDIYDFKLKKKLCLHGLYKTYFGVVRAGIDVILRANKEVVIDLFSAEAWGGRGGGGGHRTFFHEGTYSHWSSDNMSWHIMPRTVSSAIRYQLVSNPGQWFSLWDVHVYTAVQS